jgi:hypothetical protein
MKQKWYQKIPIKEVVAGIFLILVAVIAGMFDLCSKSQNPSSVTIIHQNSTSPQLLSQNAPSGNEASETYFTWRPSSPDPGDDHVIDCAMNAGATVVTSNAKDFQMAHEALGLRVITPKEFIVQLTNI